MGVVSDYLPVAVAGCCAAAIAYVALSQAYDAAADDDGGGERHSSSSATTPAAAAEPSSSSSTTSAKEVVKPSIDATADAQDATQQHAAAVASPSASGVTTSTTNSSSNNADNPSACNHCKKAPERQEQLLRCSRCHHAWYCSKECQKAAWPQHKRSCNTSGSSTNSNATSPTAASRSSSTTSPRSSSNNNAGGGAGDQQQQQSPESVSVLDALKHVLQQHSSTAADEPLQQQFEQAVLLFVSNEHRAAVTALQGVQAAAEKQGKHGLAGDCCKWLGHSYLKLGDGGKAAAAFAKGCELAEQCNNKRLQVDCLSGMGTMYRDAGQLPAAGGFLRQALRVATALGEEPLRASVLTLLGTVLIGSDGPAAVGHLEEAVNLREDQVIALHEAGQRGSALASAIMEHAGSLVSLAGAYYVEKRYTDAADAYSKSLAIFDLIEDIEKQCKCLINLANLYELQLEHPDSRTAAAEQRKQLYRLTSAHVGRQAPETCAICCEPVNALRPTEGEGQKLLLLGCAHCFHYKCWEDWSESKGATCPSCKQPGGAEMQSQQHPQAPRTPS